MKCRQVLWKAMLLPAALLGAGGPPPGGPGGPPPGGPGGPGEPEEPVKSLAETVLEDYASLRNPEPVGFTLDLGLMSPITEAGKSVFAEDRPVTATEVEQAISAIRAMPLRGEVEIPVFLSKTRGALAVELKNILTAGLPGLPELHYNDAIRVQEGTKILDAAYIFLAGGNAVENGGTSELVVRNSTIRGTTTKQSKCLSGPPSGLTIGGSIRTTLAVHQSQGIYINCKIISKDWAVFSTDGAEPVGADGERELSIYTYGTEGVATDAGYGTYSDLFCNASFYGSKLTAPELGAISGTFGTLTFDTIAAGEEAPMLAKYLRAEDKALWPDKHLGSHLTGGRNAIMIHCVSLPPYWGRPGYSQEELPYHEGVVTVRHSTLETDMTLDRHIEYPDQVPAYLRHVAGSVILVRSCNAKILLEDVRVLPDPKGTGAILHTAINSDLPFMVRVPDGTTYPGSHVTVKDSVLTGDILHEDYQRDLYLTLENSRLAGRVFSGTVDTWNTFCMANACENYIIDPEGYQTVHGTRMTVGKGATWTVTGESNLTDLEILECGCVAAPEGKQLSVTMDGTPVELHNGSYHGDIRIAVIE